MISLPLPPVAENVPLMCAFEAPAGTENVNFWVVPGATVIVLLTMLVLTGGCRAWFAASIATAAAAITTMTMIVAMTGFDRNGFLGVGGRVNS